MNPYYSDSWLTVYGGDCRTILSELPAESVHTVITSPPYWGLRDYGTATWEGGGWTCGGKHELMKADPEWWSKSTAELREELEAEPTPDADACPICGAPPCDHRGAPKQSGSSTLAGNGHGNGKPLSPSLQAQTEPVGRDCPKCGARRIDSQLGLEQTAEEYVRALVDVFREVRRVLRSDGTVWLNLGDSYAASTATQGRNENRSTVSTLSDHGTDGRSPSLDAQQSTSFRRDLAGLKPKDLVGIPWRVAFALQADGWYLRSDIIWSKPNPMPESVTDRPTKSHEYLFLLAKSQRYFFDADAVREPNAPASIQRMQKPWNGDEGRDYPAGQQNHLSTFMGSDRARAAAEAGRNIRSVWTIATAPYPGAHFATFPPKLVEPCVKAGCPADGVVLDPFAGTGTVGMVAQSLSRRAILIDLSPDYLRQCLERNRDIPLGLPA